MSSVSYDSFIVIAALVAAISMRRARSCPNNRDHRDSPLRGGPVMTMK